MVGFEGQPGETSRGVDYIIEYTVCHLDLHYEFHHSLLVAIVAYFPHTCIYCSFFPHISRPLLVLHILSNENTFPKTRSGLPPSLRRSADRVAF